MAESLPIPDACTLPNEERPLRVAEFAALFARAPHPAARPAPGRLRLTFPSSPETATTLRDLVARESVCCAFFDFTITDGPGGLVLDIAVPAGHEPILDALAGLAATASPRGSA